MFIILISSVIFSLEVLATEKIEISSTCRDSYVYDEANMIDAETEQKLNDLLGELERESTAEVVVVSYETSGLPMQRKAYAYFDSLKMGKVDKNTGVLLLMQKDGNHVRVEIGNGIDDDFSYEVAGEILNKHYIPYRDEDTSKAALETAKALASNMYAYYGIENELTKEISPSLYGDISLSDKLLPCIVFIGIALYLVAGFGIEFLKKKLEKSH